MDFFSVLGCNPDDDPDTLRKAWRKLCLEHHPDHGGDSDKFVEVTHAYRMITDPSYARKQTVRPVRDLTFNIQMITTFDDAFYGTKLVVSYNQLTLGTNLEIQKTDKVIPVSFAFDLPPGAVSGFRHIEKRKGKKWQNQTGDAVVSVTAERHPRYTVKGLDVFVEENIKLDVMLKGDYISVETLWGVKMVWVSPGTKPGDRLRVVGCGVDKKGHQYCAVKPIYPEEKDLKSQSTWKSLGINWSKADKQNEEDSDLFKKFEEMKK